MRARNERFHSENVRFARSGRHLQVALDPDRTLHAPIQNLLSGRVRDRTGAFGSDNRCLVLR